jgi:hypothetical protein
MLENNPAYPLQYLNLLQDTAWFLLHYLCKIYRLINSLENITRPFSPDTETGRFEPRLNLFISTEVLAACIP